ncbi:MAG TPA: Fe-S cluster assembly protein SufB [Acidimicrobiales bacterium]
MTATDLDLGRYKLGWADDEEFVFRPEKGVNADVVDQMSWWKGEPDWMRKFRLRSLRTFERKPMAPWFAVNMPDLDFDDIYYYIKPTQAGVVDEWDELPEQMKATYEKLGIPEAERKYLAGVTAQYECLRGDTLVLTTRGARRIKDLGPGDEVFSLDEASRQIVVGTVVGQACSGDKEILEVTAGGRTIGASGNHPFLVLRDERRDGRQRARWVAAEALEVGDLVAVATDLPPSHAGLRDELLVTSRVLSGVGASPHADGAGVASSFVTNAIPGNHANEMVGFAQVESIVRAGVEPTYDIEVAGHHNFVAEGFVVHNSEVVYHRNREDLEKQGILFCDMDTALREYPELVKQYFGTIIPPGDNKFAALNSSVWSGGSFIYVPPGVECEMPLQAYFRINSQNAGQFERTLIIADEGAKVHYIEGCSAPVYTSDSLHSAVVEIVVKPSARVTYTTIQNWSPNVYNLVTKRARVEAEGHMEWIDGNIGSKLTMKYPSVFLVGPKATGEVLSVAYAGPGQHQDAGAKMIHAAPETTSKIVSKSISKDGGITTYRGLVRVEEGAYGCKSHVQCDALILDEDSVSRTFPYMEVGERDAQIGHEATVSKVADEQLFYLMSRGLTQEQAMGMIVNGFIEPVTRTLPMEYAVEWSRLIELQMEGSVG